MTLFVLYLLSVLFRMSYTDKVAGFKVTGVVNIVCLSVDEWMFVCFSVPGTFKLTVEFTEEYPNKPPTVRFVSKMFHPNGRYPGTQHIILLVFAEPCLSL